MSSSSLVSEHPPTAPAGNPPAAGATPRLPDASEQPTMAIWPDAAHWVGIKSKSAAYRAARDGRIPTVRLGARRYVVPTAALRTMLGMPVDGHA